MTGSDILKYVVAAMGGAGTSLVAWRQLRKERAEAATNSANLAAGHLNTLSQQLMTEREASEKRFERLQTRADAQAAKAEKLAEKVDDLERDASHRQLKLEAAEERIAAMSHNLDALYLYTGELEAVIRATGIAAPARPAGLIVLPGRDAPKHP